MNRKHLAIATGIAALSAAVAIPASSAFAAPASGATTSPATSVAASSLGTAHYLPLAMARKAAEAAMADCATRGYPVSVTVVDRDGIVIDQERADTATGATVNVSENKAYAAVGFQVPTAALQESAKTSPGFTSIAGFSILPGGLPISAGGSIIAGIGVSGAVTGEIDAACATVGLQTIK